MFESLKAKMKSLFSRAEKKIDEKIAHDSALIVNDKDLTEEQALHFMAELRIFRKYADELIEEMEEDDRDYDQRLANYRANQEALKAEAKQEQDNDE